MSGSALLPRGLWFRTGPATLLVRPGGWYLLVPTAGKAVHDAAWKVLADPPSAEELRETVAREAGLESVEDLPPMLGAVGSGPDVSVVLQGQTPLKVYAASGAETLLPDDEEQLVRAFTDAQRIGFGALPAEEGSGGLQIIEGTARVRGFTQMLVEPQDLDEQQRSTLAAAVAEDDGSIESADDRAAREKAEKEREERRAAQRRSEEQRKQAASQRRTTTTSAARTRSSAPAKPAADEGPNVFDDLFASPAGSAAAKTQKSEENAAPEPEAKPAPKPTAKPVPAPQPEVTAEPEAKPAPEPEGTPMPEPSARAEAPRRRRLGTSLFDRRAASARPQKPSAQSTSAPEPTPQQQEPTPQPEAAPTPAPQPEPQQEPELAPAPQPEPQQEPEPAPAPQPEPQQEPEPQLAPAHQPEPPLAEETQIPVDDSEDAPAPAESTPPSKQSDPAPEQSEPALAQPSALQPPAPEVSTEESNTEDSSTYDELFGATIIRSVSDAVVHLPEDDEDEQSEEPSASAQERAVDQDHASGPDSGDPSTGLDDVGAQPDPVLEDPSSATVRPHPGEPPSGGLPHAGSASADTAAASAPTADGPKRADDFIDWVPGVGRTVPAVAQTAARRAAGASSPHAPAPASPPAPPHAADPTSHAVPQGVALADGQRRQSGTASSVQPTVPARTCPAGHHSSPERSSCRICDAPLGARITVVPRPTRGVVEISTGEQLALDRGMIIGRRPRASRVSGQSVPQLITVPSPQQDISRSHVELRLEGWSVIAQDLDTTNGTVLLREGEEPRRLRPLEDTVLMDGDVLDLGDGVMIRWWEDA